MSQLIKTLHIDIEGGFGGSSRSLFELVSRLDRDRFDPLIIHRAKGPVEDRYRSIGIPTIHVPEIVSYAPRKHKSLKNLIATMPRILKMGRAVRQIASIAKDHQIDLIHLNYEGLFLMAGPLKKQTNLPLVGHSRTEIPDNCWGAWEARSLARSVSHMFFISEQEEARFRKHVPTSDCPGDVIWNIAAPPATEPKFPDDPVAVYLGNVDHVKGADRLIDIAASLEKLGAPKNLSIAIYGSARNNPEYYQELVRRIETEKISHRVQFMGFTDQPDKVISSALALIRPSRWNDPWGRDVIEACRQGLPTLATGSFQGVIEPGKTGFLYDPFSADAMAADLIRLATDQAYWESLSQAAREKGQEKFSGVAQVKTVQSAIEGLLASTR